jgi:hypothetical protein
VFAVKIPGCLQPWYSRGLFFVVDDDDHSDDDDDDDDDKDDVYSLCKSSVENSE